MKNDDLIRVAVAIVFKEGKFLLCQRKKTARYGLKWEFPGGKLEPGETAHNCMTRELQEELDIVPGTILREEVHRSAYDDGHIYEVHFCFLADFSGEPENRVFESIGWFSPEELKHLDILDGNKELVARLVASPMEFFRIAP